jgi:hypothetical protein
MPRHRPFQVLSLLLPALALDCTTTPELTPLNAKERAEIEALRRHDARDGIVTDKGTLFVSLDQNLRKWRELCARTDVSDMDQRRSLEVILTTQVYWNFDTILGELAHGTDPDHKVTAAAAIGWSRIPAPDEPGGDPAFPAVHPRAVAPLLAVIGSGQDELVINALLSLARLHDPGTPRELLVELMVKHHHADVRSNAAYALSELVAPADGALLPSLFSSLSDPSPTVRLHVLKALGRIGDKAAVAAMVERLQRDDTPLVQACAAMELGKLGDWSTVGPLIEGLNSDATLLAFQCHHALVRLTGQQELKGYPAWREWWNGAKENPSRLQS